MKRAYDNMSKELPMLLPHQNGLCQTLICYDVLIKKFVYKRTTLTSRIDQYTYFKDNYLIMLTFS